MNLFQRFQAGQYVADPMLPHLTHDGTLGAFSRGSLRVLLINPPIREWSFPNIEPLGQEYVAAAAWMDGHDVRALDLNAERLRPVTGSLSDFTARVERRIAQALDEHQPQVVGLGGIITQYGWIKRIAALVRQLRPETVLLLGGGIASSIPRFMAERLPVDVIVLEEGEVTGSEVLARIAAGECCAGIQGTLVNLPGGQIVDGGLRPSVKPRHEGLDHLPWPLRALWPHDTIYKRNPVGHLNWQSKWVDGAARADTPFSVSMIASRGCPYAAKACDYCYAAYLGATYRLRSPADVVDEMQWLMRRYGARYIHFLDDLLLTDYRWALAFADEIIRRKFEVEWGGTCRTNIAADDVLRARREGRPHMLERAYEAGMRHVGYGVESASPTILKAIDKSGQTLEKMEVAVQETQRIFGYADCSFMIGSPGETEGTVRETMDFCRRVGLQPEVFFFTTAYPGTTFWQLALDRGLITKSVIGQSGPADDDMIERYFLRLGEQGESVRTNFSDLPDHEVEALARWAVAELKPAGSRIREPHSGEEMGVVGATRADL